MASEITRSEAVEVLYVALCEGSSAARNWLDFRMRPLKTLLNIYIAK